MGRYLRPLSSIRAKISRKIKYPHITKVFEELTKENNLKFTPSVIILSFFEKKIYYICENY